MKEVRKDELRDFHRTRPSGSGMVTEKPPSVEKITPIATSERTDESNDENDSESEGNDEENESDDDKTQSDNEKEVKDDEKEEGEFIHTPSHTDDKDDANLESKSDDKIEEVVQKEGVDAEMTDAQKEKENLEILYDQVIEDAHLTTTNVPKETEVLATSSSRSFDLASKFLIFSDIHPFDAKIVSPLDVPIHHEMNGRGNLERIHEFLWCPLTAWNHKASKESDASNLPEEVSNFAPPVIEKTIEKSLKEVTLAKVSSQPQSTYEAAATLTEFELMKILIDKMDKSESYLDCQRGISTCQMLVRASRRWEQVSEMDRGLKKRKTSKDAKPTTSPKNKDSTSGSSKGTKSQPKSSGKSVQSEEPEFEVADSDMPQDQEGNLGNDDDKPRKEAASRRDDYPFDLSKPLPLVTSGNRQRVPVDYFINNDLKYLQGGVLTMTYTTFYYKTKATLYGYARGLESRHDVYFTKRILAVTHVNVMKKHGYGYLEEIVVRRADNDLYRFKECDFSRLRINDIEDMLLLVRVEDLQLGVESYQKHINVTRPDTTRLDLYKKHPYTPYKDTSYETDLKLLQRTI
ncbi:hypothetical protein Tco_0835093 [Tanacetum coccineum]